ncbi:hypothetical protein [Zymobacter sp. IVIA_5232.4 C2]|uniref:hypothetical protein n=1 Tax=Zymobacter sp. IVIA_5232.4 C2 TaxID=3394855 RepID=UPI0039C1E601
MRSCRRNGSHQESRIRVAQCHDPVSRSAHGGPYVPNAVGGRRTLGWSAIHNGC